MTLRILEVVAVLMEAPEGEVYGLQVMQQTGLASGAAYPLLEQMKQAGWVTGRWEDIDEHKEGRRARQYYRITPDGVVAARQAMSRLPLSLTGKEA
jgi:DNA-binding PadR family transcriptional regulator